MLLVYYVLMVTGTDRNSALFLHTFVNYNSRQTFASEWLEFIPFLSNQMSTYTVNYSVINSGSGVS